MSSRSRSEDDYDLLMKVSHSNSARGQGVKSKKKAASWRRRHSR
jgi:hypothetical protein